MSEHNDETKDREIALIDSHVAQLMEHFDSVQILATRTKSDGTTIGVTRGRGNWYSRVGYAREWLLRDDEYNRINVREENEDDD